MEHNGSERPPSVRQVESLDDGTIVKVEYDPGREVVRPSYYWTPDAELLSRILSATLRCAGATPKRTSRGRTRARRSPGQ